MSVSMPSLRSETPSIDVITLQRYHRSMALFKITVTRKALMLVGLLGFSATGMAADWTYQWDATTTLPTDAGWLQTGVNPNVPLPSGFIIPDNTNYRHEFDGDASTGWTLQMVVRRADDGEGFGSLLALSDGTFSMEWNYFGQLYYRTNSDAGLRYVPAADSDNTQFVTLQITRLGNEINVYYNQNDTPVSTFTCTDGPYGNTILLGDLSDSFQITELQSIYWTTQGAFLPSQMIPEPGTALLVTSSLAAGLLLGRRKLFS